MAINVTKLYKLSRNKTTGNVIILLMLIIGGSSLLYVIGIGLHSNADKITFLGGLFLSILCYYIVDKKLRRPFFLEISSYLEELINRRIDVQQAIDQIGLIETLQSITNSKAVLTQIDDLNIKMKEISQLISTEISINSPPLRVSRIQRELREIDKLVGHFLKEIAKKRKNIVFFTQVRQIILNAINTQLIRPRNEIESDYLFYKVRKSIQENIVDDHFLQRILDHILARGEIRGRLERNEIDGMILAVEGYYNGEVISDFAWQESEQPENQCVICRYPIGADTDIVTCPFCQNAFHQNHLLEWLKVFNQCPICQRRLTLFSNPY